MVDALLAAHSDLDAFSRIDVLLAGEALVAGRSVEREAGGRTGASDVAAGKSWRERTRHAATLTEARDQRYHSNGK